MKEVKCPNCGKVVMEASLRDGTVRRKCKCGHVVEISVRPAGQAQPAAYQDRIPEMRRKAM